MDKSYKTYKKALNEYQSGNIDKAVEFCEKSISQNMKCTASLNLKGLLYYLKGDLKNARALWKLNYAMNKDSVSKKYLEDTIKDEKNGDMYYKALVLIKKLGISEAIEILEKCRKSDYNYINVYNSLANCYIKKGQYNKAAECVDKVSKVDRRNETMLQYRKELASYGILDKKTNFKPILALVLIICIVAALTVLRKPIEDKAKKVFSKKETKQIVKVPKKTPVKKEIVVPKPVVEQFPRDDVNKAISEKNNDALYDYVTKWKSNVTSVDDKTVISKAEEVLRTDGVKYFHDTGLNFAKSKDFSKAEEKLLKAYNFGDKSYLYQDIIYWLGFSFENESKIEECFKYYTQYDSSFPSGSYEETVLYKLAILNKDIDLQKAKVYANKLSSSFPKSPYNNSNIKEIMNK